MALIYVYDASDLDKKQLGEAMTNTDHSLVYVEDKISVENLNSEAEMIAVFVTSTVTREMIEAMPKLKVIACRSTGFNNIDLQAAKERGVSVLNVPTYGEQTVAEYAFTMLLALVRKLPKVLESENLQFRLDSFLGHDLGGKTIGVIGTGHIGQKSLAIAKGFSMNSIAYDAFPRQELEAELGFKYVSLDELLEKSDIITLHAPLVADTKHIINRDRLALMKRGAVIVNTARGELIDNHALIEALESGQVGGAALDVIEGEALLNYEEEIALLRKKELPESALQHSLEISILKKMPNVIVSPHNAFNTYEAVLRINNTTARNLIDYWYGNTPNLVNIPEQKPGKLIITRHTESEWNATGQWSGTSDVHLSEKGFREASDYGIAVKKAELPVDIAYCSEQIRTRETLEGLLNAAQLFKVDIVRDKALNERDYGEYTGKNKWEMKAVLGEEKFNNIRRGWNEPIPGGETLKDVYERVIPFYQQVILPLLLKGKNVLIAAHGNSLRSLIKYIESISDEEVENLEMLFGEIVVYDVDPDGKLVNKDVLSVDVTPPNA